jgi:hypothetical protein
MRATASKTDLKFSRGRLLSFEAGLNRPMSGVRRLRLKPKRVMAKCAAIVANSRSTDSSQIGVALRIRNPRSRTGHSEVVISVFMARSISAGKLVARFCCKVRVNQPSKTTKTRNCAALTAPRETRNWPSSRAFLSR